MILELETELPFGKHAGMSVAWVLDNDPSYIVWLADNTDHAIDLIAVDEARKAVARGEA